MCRFERGEMGQANLVLPIFVHLVYTTNITYNKISYYFFFIILILHHGCFIVFIHFDEFYRRIKTIIVSILNIGPI